MSDAMKWQIQCGAHRGTIAAKSIGVAWRWLTKDKTEGFAELARFRQIKPTQGPWFYITPAGMEKLS